MTAFEKSLMLELIEYLTVNFQYLVPSLRSNIISREILGFAKQSEHYTDSYFGTFTPDDDLNENGEGVGTMFLRPWYTNGLASYISGGYWIGDLVCRSLVDYIRDSGLEAYGSFSQEIGVNYKFYYNLKNNSL